MGREKGERGGWKPGRSRFGIFLHITSFPKLDHAHLRVKKCSAFRLGRSDLANRNTGCLVQFQIRLSTSKFFAIFEHILPSKYYLPEMQI